MGTDQVMISEELVAFYKSITGTLEKHASLMPGQINGREAKVILDGLGKAGSQFRLHIYEKAFSGVKKPISLDDLKDFVEQSLQYLEHSIEANRRSDHLYHAYNLMSVINDDEIAISHLSEMLEGQVAVLSSGYLSCGYKGTIFTV